MGQTYLCQTSASCQMTRNPRTFAINWLELEKNPNPASLKFRRGPPTSILRAA